MLDEPRILSRLRSSHAARTRKTAGKPGLLPSLRRTVYDESIYSRDEPTRARITSIRSSATQLFQRFSDFEAARGSESTLSVSRDVLIDVLIGIYEFDVRGLQTVLETSPVIDPSLKTYLPRAMSKLGRYYCVACDLIDAARSSKYTLFRHVSVRAIEKPPLDTAFIASHSAGFDQTLQRVTRSSHQHGHKTYDSASVSAARMKFQSRMSNCATPWKIHAEIQLLLFYEQQPHIYRPRIISSSKSACYLCDLFLRLHGEFQTPRTHGRLYDRWILPERAINDPSANGRLLPVIDRFNAALEAEIVHLLNHRRLPFPHPDESVLLLREPWSSNSTLSRACNQGSIHETTDPACTGSSGDHAEPSSNTSPGSLATLTVSTERDRADAQQWLDGMQADMPPSRPIAIFRRLSRGDSTCCKLTNRHDSLIVQTDAARIHASWDFHSVDTAYDPFATDRACWVQVKWLACDGQTAHNDGSFECIDINSLACSHDRILEGGAALSSKELALQREGHIILVKYAFEDPRKRDGA